MNVSWKNPNEYATQPAKKQQIESTVKNSSEASGAQKRGASDAIIRGGIHQSKPPGDQKDHVTVDFKKSDGTHITTKHVHT